jgi:hypothetical protein
MHPAIAALLNSLNQLRAERPTHERAAARLGGALPPGRFAGRPFWHASVAVT